jgi:hypothetical protein
MNDLLDVDENYEDAHEFNVYLSRPFRSRFVWTFPWGGGCFFVLGSKS